MANFGDIVTNVSQIIIDPNNTAVDVATVKTYVNKAIAYWKLRRFWFNEVNDTATLTTHDNAFPYPSDFLVPALKDDGFCIEYSGIRYPMAKISEPAYDSFYIANGYGLPTWYARTGSDEYRCWPIPNMDYTVRRHYLRDYEDLVNDADTNDFTDYASDLIEAWASYRIASRLRQDLVDADELQKQAMDEYRQLRVMTNKANATGKIALSSNLLVGAY